MCENHKPFLQCHNKQHVVVSKVLSVVPQRGLHSLIFHSSTWVRSMTTNDCLLLWRRRRRAGVNFPACRGSTWLCVGGSAAVVWPPSIPLQGLMPGWITIQTSARSPLTRSRLYSFIINTADTLAGEALGDKVILHNLQFNANCFQ